MSLTTGERGDLADKPSPLGAPIRPEPVPPKSRQISPGIWRQPDGKLSTDLPLPTAPTPAAPRLCSTCMYVATPSNHAPCLGCISDSARPNWSSRMGGSASPRPIVIIAAIGVGTVANGE